MNKIFIRDAGVIDCKTNKKYFTKSEFFKRLDNAIYLANKNSIGLQLTINKNFFLKHIIFFFKKLKDLKKLNGITIHLYAPYHSLISSKKETSNFIKLLNKFTKTLSNIKGYCIHPDNVSNYLFLKELKIKRRYVAIEVCDLKSKCGNNVAEIREILKKNKFLDLVLDSSHIQAIREKFSNEFTVQQYFNEFQKRIVEIQISSNTNEYRNNIFTKNFKTDHSLLSLSRDPKIYNALIKIKDLKKINLVIEGIVPFNLYGLSLLKKEIDLLNSFQ